jgi:hypothetical protein
LDLELGFGIWDLEFVIWDLEFGIWDLGFGICDLEFVFTGDILERTSAGIIEIFVKFGNW